MLFKGRLRLPNDPGEGIPIDLELEDVFLSLESGGEDFGEWRLDTVEIKRLFSNQFALYLDGEEMVFIAADALGFAYEGLTAVDDVKSRLSKRRVFKGRKPKRRTVTARSEPEPAQVESDDSPHPDGDPDLPMPEVVPFFPESSPSFAESVAESATVDDGIAPVAPRPIEIAGVEPEPGTETPPLPPEPEPEVEQPEPVVESARHVDPRTAPQLRSEHEEDDDELVIEDVSAYGYVPMASAQVEQRPAAVEPEPADEPIDIEEAPPATGAGLKQTHPLGDRATRPPAREIHPLGEPDEPARSAVEPEEAVGNREPDGAPVAAETEAAAKGETPAPSDGVQPGPPPPEGDSSFFAQWSSNGRSDTAAEPLPEPVPDDGADEDSSGGTGPQTQRSGRHARSVSKSRSSMFGRKKSREPEEHEHRYESSKTVGGITRRVCAVCGHVSFAGEDVYQDW